MVRNEAEQHAQAKEQYRQAQSGLSVVIHSAVASDSLVDLSANPDYIQALVALHKLWEDAPAMPLRPANEMTDDPHREKCPAFVIPF